MASSTNEEVLNGHTLSKSQYMYATPTVNKAGGKNIQLKNSTTKQKLYVSSPLMLTWGVNENDYEGKGKVSYDMSLQFPRESDANYSDQTTGFLKGLTELEDQIKADAVTNSKEWFNKAKMSTDVVDALWSPMLKFPKDPARGEPHKTRAPTLRIKLPYWEGKFNCEFWSPKHELLFPVEGNDSTPTSIVQKGQTVALVIECGGIWFANGKFGVTWKLVQGVVQPRTGLRGKCHIAIDPSVTSRLESEAVEVANAEEDAEEEGVEVEDSEDEEEEEEDSVHTQVKQEVAAEVAPKVVKKVVKRGRKTTKATE